MKVEAESVWRDDEEDLKLLSVSLVDPPVPDADAVRFELFSRAMNVGNQDGRAILRSITTVDGEPNLYAVPLENHGGARVTATLYFLEPKSLAVPLGSCVEIDDGQREHVFLVRKRPFEQCCLWHGNPLTEFRVVAIVPER